MPAAGEATLEENLRNLERLAKAGPICPVI